jgi:hypothetical protein
MFVDQFVINSPSIQVKEALENEVICYEVIIHVKSK